MLTLKAPVTTAADDNFFYLFIFFLFFRENKSYISCESWQTIHMKCQYLFSLKKKKKPNVVCYKFCLALQGLRQVHSEYGKELTLCMLGKVFSRRHIKTFFSGKNKKKI